MLGILISAVLALIVGAAAGYTIFRYVIKGKYNEMIAVMRHSCVSAVSYSGRASQLRSGSGAHSPTPLTPGLSSLVASTNHDLRVVYTPRDVPAGCLKCSVRGVMVSLYFIRSLYVCYSSTSSSASSSLVVSSLVSCLIFTAPRRDIVKTNGT